MRQAGRDSVVASAAWLRAEFCDEVEHEIEELDSLDFVDFLEADREPVPVRAEFRRELRGKLREFVRTRYSV